VITAVVTKIFYIISLAVTNSQACSVTIYIEMLIYWKTQTSFLILITATELLSITDVTSSGLAIHEKLSVNMKSAANSHKNFFTTLFAFS